MNIFLDFDGTIVDPAPRYHWVYARCLELCDPGGDGAETPLDLARYWDCKRAHMPETSILAAHHPRIDPARYHEHRMPIIEATDVLARDPLLPGAGEALIALGQQHTLYLVTLRRNRAGLMAELDGLEIRAHFAEILSGPGGQHPHQVKMDLIGARASSADWIAGDTEADIAAGKALGLRTCGVASGIRTEEFLRSLDPDHVIDGLADLPALVDD